MFTRFGTLLIIAISAVLVFSVTADAINVDSVGPESSYDNYIWTGSTQYSRTEVKPLSCNQTHRNHHKGEHNAPSV